MICKQFDISHNQRTRSRRKRGEYSPPARPSPRLLFTLFLREDPNTLVSVNERTEYDEGLFAVEYRPTARCVARVPLHQREGASAGLFRPPRPPDISSSWTDLDSSSHVRLRFRCFVARTESAAAAVAGAPGAHRPERRRGLPENASPSHEVSGGGSRSCCGGRRRRS